MTLFSILEVIYVSFQGNICLISRSLHISQLTGILVSQTPIQYQDVELVIIEKKFRITLSYRNGRRKKTIEDNPN